MKNLFFLFERCFKIATTKNRMYAFRWDELKNENPKDLRDIANQFDAVACIVRNSIECDHKDVEKYSRSEKCKTCDAYRSFEENGETGPFGSIGGNWTPWK